MELYGKKKGIFIMKKNGRRYRRLNQSNNSKEKTVKQIYRCYHHKKPKWEMSKIKPEDLVKIPLMTQYTMFVGKKVLSVSAESYLKLIEDKCVCEKCRKEFPKDVFEKMQSVEEIYKTSNISTEKILKRMGAESTYFYIEPDGRYVYLDKEDIVNGNYRIDIV